nr:hypothetical protein [Allomuricauda sp.]
MKNRPIDIGKRLREASINCAIAVQRLNWAWEDLIENEVKEDAQKGLESVKGFLKGGTTST